MFQSQIAIGDAQQWKNCDVELLQAVLEGTYQSFSGMIGYELDKHIIVTNVQGDNSPMIFYPQDTQEDRENYKIVLNIPDASDWGKVIYQFSHEVGHAYCQYYKSKVHKHKWFEEVLCEAIAISNINNIYRNWNALALSTHPHVSAIREQILSYLNKVLQDVPKDITAANILEFLNNCLPVFEIKSITKIWDLDSIQKLQAVAWFLCENLFYHDVQRWRAVKFLNEWDASADKNFVDFMKNWAKCGDDNVKVITATLGIIL